MVIPFLTQPPHERTLTGRGSRVYPNVGAAGCTLTSGQPGVAWSGQEVCSGFALAARCMNSYYTIRIKKMYELVQKPHYEFVLYNLQNNCIQKLAKKRFASGLGFQPGTKMACNRRSATPSTTPPQP